MVWQNLVRRWLYQQAAERVRETVADAASATRTRDDAATAGDEPCPSHDGPSAACQVAVLFDSKSAAGSLLDRVGDQITLTGSGFSAHQGNLAERRVVVAVLDQGQETAAPVAQALISAHRPQWIISAGFAYALAQDLRRSDLVMATSVAGLTGADLNCSDTAARMPAETVPQLRTGRMLTINAVPSTARQKKELGDQHGALAVDKHSFAIAKVAGETKTQVLVLRAIRATLDDQPPAELKVLESQKSLAGKLGAATGALMRRPGSAKDWWENTEQSLAIADRLAETLEKIVPLLVDKDDDATASSEP